MNLKTHCLIFGAICEGHCVFLGRILPSRLAVVLLCQKEGLVVPGNLITSHIRAGSPVVPFKVRRRKLNFKGFFKSASTSSGGYLQFLQQLDAIVGKGLLFFRRIHQHKCEGFRGRRYIARFLHHFRNGKIPFERWFGVGGYFLRCPCGGGQTQCHDQGQQQGE